MSPAITAPARHRWLIGPIKAGRDRAISDTPDRMVTIWAADWHPSRLFTILDLKCSRTVVLEAPYWLELRAVEVLIAAEPERMTRTFARMVLLSGFAPSLSPAVLAAAGIEVTYARPVDDPTIGAEYFAKEAYLADLVT